MAIPLKARSWITVTFQRALHPKWPKKYPMTRPTPEKRTTPDKRSPHRHLWTAKPPLDRPRAFPRVMGIRATPPRKPSKPGFLSLHWGTFCIPTRNQCSRRKAKQVRMDAKPKLLLQQRRPGPRARREARISIWMKRPLCRNLRVCLCDGLQTGIHSLYFRLDQTQPRLDSKQDLCTIASIYLRKHIV